MRLYLDIIIQPYGCQTILRRFPMKNKISQFRKKSNLTQRQLAEKVGILYQVLQRYENGTRIPSVDTAIRIARALNATVEEIFIVDD